MSLSILEMLGMRLRGTPVRRLRECLRQAHAAGVRLDITRLEVHLLAGGNPERVVEAMVVAKQEGVEPDWMRLAAFDLTGTDPVTAVRRSIPEHELVFDRYAADREEKILGYCRDGTAVRAACHVLYRLPLVPDAAPLLTELQERLSTRIAVLANTAESLPGLEARKSEHEVQLLALAHQILPTVKRVQVRIARA